MEKKAERSSSMSMKVEKIRQGAPMFITRVETNWVSKAVPDLTQEYPIRAQINTGEMIAKMS